MRKGRGKVLEKLIKEVERLIRKELAMANEKFPLFHSNHEGVAVIEEECFEAWMEFERLEGNMTELKTCVFSDASREEAKIFTEQIYCDALMGACELIQVAAMAKKFDESTEARCAGSR